MHWYGELRYFICSILNPSVRGNKYERLSKIFDIFIIINIFASLIIIQVESIESVRVKYESIIMIIETIILYIFVVEYILRIWSITSESKYRSPVKGRLLFMITPLAIIDLLAISPVFITFISLNLSFVRVLRLFRIFRLFKAGRYFSSKITILEVIRNKKSELLATFMGVIFLVIVASNVMYLFEKDAQPGSFSSIPATFWWSIITLTTIGYGDVYPITLGGKISASIIALLGVGFVSIPAGIIAGGFTETMMRKKEGILENKEYSNHIVICGWNNMCYDIIVNLLNAKSYIETVVILADMETSPTNLDRLKDNTRKIIDFISGNPANIEDLERAKVRNSKSVIIVTEDDQTSPKTLLIAAAIESIDPKIFTTAIIKEIDTKQTIQSISSKFNIDEIICIDEIASYIAVGSSLNKGLYKIFNELFDFGIGNNFYKIGYEHIPMFIKKKTFSELTVYFLGKDVKILAVESSTGEIMIHPKKDYILSEGDNLFIIAEDLPRL